MEEITTKKKIKKYIETETEDEVTVYKTADGEIFDGLRDALAHEDALRFKSVEKLSFWFPMVNEIWYKAKDRSELEFLIDFLSTNYGGMRYGDSRLKPGEWFTVSHENRDNTPSPVDHFLSLGKLKNDYSLLLDVLENDDTDTNCEKYIKFRPEEYSLINEHCGITFECPICRRMLFTDSKDDFVECKCGNKYHVSPILYHIAKEE